MDGLAADLLTEPSLLGEILPEEKRWVKDLLDLMKRPDRNHLVANEIDELPSLNVLRAQHFDSCAIITEKTVIIIIIIRYRIYR